jgi:hypothetical protein
MGAGYAYTVPGQHTPDGRRVKPGAEDDDRARGGRAPHRAGEIAALGFRTRTRRHSAKQHSQLVVIDRPDVLGRVR